MIKFHLSREWLETNGIGGFASSTISSLNTRGYHALLTAATKPPVGRLVLLSKFEETLVIDGRHYELSANTRSSRNVDWISRKICLIRVRLRLI